MESYKRLRVWQMGMDVVVETYKVTASFPKDERFGLVSQMRRAAASIPANVAEGYRRGHRAEWLQFARIAYGSVAELETHIEIARRTELAADGEFVKLLGFVDQISRMLNRLVASLR